MSNSFIEPTNLEQYYLTQEMNVDFATTPGIPLTIRVDGIQVYPLEAKLFDASKLDDTLKTIQTCGYDVLPLGEIAQSVMGQEIKSDAVGLSLYLFIKSQFPNLEYIDDWSLWLDVKLLIKTIPAVIFSKGAV